MQKHQTQQFAKFYLKDLKSQDSEYNNKKADIDQSRFTTSK